MSALILRVVGAIVALAGLVAVIVGGWFLNAIGTSGTATFTGEPDQRVVVLAPDVLNRVDSPVEVTATGDGALWAGTARPSDVEALLGDAPRAEMTAVDVSEWAVTTSDMGDGEATDFTGPDIWQASTQEEGSVTMTIDQSDAPQTLVISAGEDATVEQLEYQVSDEQWGSTALVVLVVGAVVLLLGVALVLTPRLLRTRSVRRADPTTEEA